VTPNDPSALAKAINDALANPEGLRRFGEAGRQRLVQRFTAERMARETMDVYRRAIEHSRRSK
jgi:glycosyltransferase involved in cell wall biosynthesis